MNIDYKLIIFKITCCILHILFKKNYGKIIFRRPYYTKLKSVKTVFELS